MAYLRCKYGEGGTQTLLLHREKRYWPPSEHLPIAEQSASPTVDRKAKELFPCCLTLALAEKSRAR